MVTLYDFAPGQPYDYRTFVQVLEGTWTTLQNRTRTILTRKRTKEQQINDTITMTDRSSDNRDGDPPPPPAVSAAHHQHFLNLVQAYQSRNGGASIFDGLPDPQRNAAFRAAPSAVAPSVQRVDVAADIIARAQRQLEAAVAPVGMAPSLAAGPPQRHEETISQARRQRSAAAPHVKMASVAAAGPPQHHNVPGNVAVAPPPPPPPPPAPVRLLPPPNNVIDGAAGDYEGEGEDLANYFDVNGVSPDAEDDGDDEGLRRWEKEGHQAHQRAPCG